MTDDALSFLDDAEQPQPAPESTPEPVAAEPAPTEGEPSAAPPAAPEAPSAVPLSALLDEREKRQQATRELEELKRWKADQEAQSRPQPKPIDLIEDPEGFARQQQQMLQNAIIQDRYERSRDAAEEKHGKETVDAVVAFFNDPRHAPKTQEFIRKTDPFREAFKYYQEQKEVEEFRSVGGIEAMRAKIAAEIREQVLAEVAGAPKPATPPPSLSSASSSGAAKAPPINGFDATFGS